MPTNEEKFILCLFCSPFIVMWTAKLLFAKEATWLTLYLSSLL